MKPNSVRYQWFTVIELRDPRWWHHFIKENNFDDTHYGPNGW
jgi:hypothetical protein